MIQDISFPKLMFSKSDVVKNVTMSDSPSEKSKTNRDSLLIFALGVLVFTVGLNQEFIGFQARFALFAKEMLNYGPSFFPTVYRIPYPDYPAASTYLIYLLSLPFGKVTVLSAILPTAVTSAFILVFTYRIGAMHTREWGICAVLFALFTYNFFIESRSIALDQYTSLVTVLCFYLSYSALLSGNRKRLWLVPFLFVVGFSFRGPIGLVIPTAITCGFYIWEKEYRKCLLFSSAGLVLLGLCSSGLLLAAYLQGGDSFVKEVIRMQAEGRMDSGSKNFLFYWLNGFTSYAASYPLAIFITVISFKQIIKRENINYRFLGHLALWTVIILFGMSIPGDKKSRYVLSVVSPLSLLASYLFINSAAGGFLVGIRKIFLQICKTLPLIAFIGAAGLYFLKTYYVPISTVNYMITLGLLVVLLIFNVKFSRKFKEHSQDGLCFMSIGVLAFIIFSIGIIDPFMYNRELTRPFVEKVENLLKDKPGIIAFYKIGPDAEDIKFVVNMKYPVKPEFVRTADDLLLNRTNMYFIAKRKDFNYLPNDTAAKMDILFYGKIGHENCVVFSQNI